MSWETTHKAQLHTLLVALSIWHQWLTWNGMEESINDGHVRENFFFCLLFFVSSTRLCDSRCLWTGLTITIINTRRKKWYYLLPDQITDLDKYACRFRITITLIHLTSFTWWYTSTRLPAYHNYSLKLSPRNFKRSRGFSPS